ncbi:MAG: ABC transporter permease [Chloroflexi bacterium]|nr:ABC transporter permease [Chloroflexota bacterium]
MSAVYTVTWLLRLPYPARNMLRRWRGMLGMMVGVGIALGIGMTLLAVARASIDLYTADFRTSGADLYVVAQGGTLIPILPSDTPGTIKHARNVLARVRGMPEVSAALGLMHWSMVREREGPKRPDRPTELVVAMGVDGDPTAIPNALALKHGRWVRRSDEVVIGSKLSREQSLGLGDTLRLSDRDFTVVGIGKLRGLGLAFSADALAYMDYRALRQRAEIGDLVSIIAIDTSQPEAVRRHISELGSLSVFDAADLVKQAEDVNAAAMVMYWVLIVLTLAIAALFVSNMLGRSVAERRLEFATLRAIGIPTRTILLTVAAEALLVSVVASILGAGLSLVLGSVLNGTVAPAYALESLYSADAGLFGLVLALALGLGLVSGLFPARQATHVDPIEVLREA